jgi:hypothetical protein
LTTTAVGAKETFTGFGGAGSGGRSASGSGLGGRDSTFGGDASGDSTLSGGAAGDRTRGIDGTATSATLGDGAVAGAGRDSTFGGDASGDSTLSGGVAGGGTSGIDGTATSATLGDARQASRMPPEPNQAGSNQLWKEYFWQGVLKTGIHEHVLTCMKPPTR